jgi:hypothetical protein
VVSDPVGVPPSRPVVRRTVGPARLEARPTAPVLPELTDEWFEEVIRQVDRASAALRAAAASPSTHR